MAKRKNWTDLEVVVVIRLYLRMRAAVDANRKYTKAQMIRDVQTGVLSGRSRGSIEAKLMNISAVLQDIGRTDVSMAMHGYKPASNYQKMLTTAVISVLSSDITTGVAA